jgi:hypothetical protein
MTSAITTAQGATPTATRTVRVSSKRTLHVKVKAKKDPHPATVKPHTAPKGSIAALRYEHAQGVERAYGSTRRYADALTKQWGEGWDAIPMSGPIGDNEKALRVQITAEKKALVELAKSRKSANPHSSWSRVMEYMRGLRAEKRGTKNAPHPSIRLKADLSKVYAFAMKADNYDQFTGSQERAANMLAEALKLLGVDPLKILDKLAGK